MTDVGLSISRADLTEIVEKSSWMVPERSRERLRRVAATTDAVAFGWFHCDGVTCPGRQAGYRGIAFQTAYDTMMCEHFGIPTKWADDYSLDVPANRVEVVDA